MRHKRPFRKLGRSPAHRRALFRNLATNLVIHDRINTTLAKAKEMRPHIEKLIHKAKLANNGNYQGHLYLKKYLFTDHAITKIKEDVAPRFRNLEGGFTRVQATGRRKHDKAETAIIEFVDNPILEYEREKDAKLIEEKKIHSFWEWELKILQQEVQYFEQQLRSLQSEEDIGVQELVKELQEQYPEETFEMSEIREHVELEVKVQKADLFKMYKRAQLEEQMHQDQEEAPRYKRMFKQYAYPLESFTAKTEFNELEFLIKETAKQEEMNNIVNNEPSQNNSQK